MIAILVAAAIGGFALWAILRSLFVLLDVEGPYGERWRFMSWREWRALRAEGRGEPFWPWQS